MFVREKRIGRYTYLYLVETVRENGTIKQRIIRNLGRKEDVERRGDLDRLARAPRAALDHPIADGRRQRADAQLQAHWPAFVVRAPMA
jgi:hypothetical protein